MTKINVLIINVFILVLFFYTATSQAACTYFNDFKENQDGTVTDPGSGLVWQKCALGQIWSGSTCSGQATLMFWEKAMQAAKENRFLGKNNWRLPKLSEFRRVIGDDRECHSGPRAASARLSHPISNNGGLGDFWSSTTGNQALANDEQSLTKDDIYASSINFENGGFGGDFINYQHPVRLVRYGERTSAQGSGELKSNASLPETAPPTSKAPCVIKPVMTDEEIELCRGR